ncbi:MAG: hypothetical protein LBD99_02960 [Candidatus Margulisbacteria bacterium]|nr:hypothetical protein [Candidatus Margulisiibacteriota bacterium]
MRKKILDINKYYEIRADYLSRNKFLHLFEISAPRGFGETWAQNHLNKLAQELERPSKKLERSYSGEYDFWHKGIKIEVKASRAVDFNSKEPLYIKALHSNSKLPFDMNFQQIKPKCCDIFIWIAVWRDIIRYWVLSANDVKTNKHYSIGQRRGNVNEGQLHITNENIDEFRKYETKPNRILQKIQKISGQR